MKTLAQKHSRLRRGFTLMEVMVVVGIIGMIMAMGGPTLYRMLHREGYSKTINDLMEMLSTARARAILQETTTEVVFHPKEGRGEIQGGTGADRTGAPKSISGTVQFGDNVTVEMLDINLIEYKDAPVARVRFFPNGTSDELTLILRSDQDEWRKISLEITTGLASLDVNPNQWR